MQIMQISPAHVAGHFQGTFSSRPTNALTALSALVYWAMAASGYVA